MTTSNTGLYVTSTRHLYLVTITSSLFLYQSAQHLIELAVAARWLARFAFARNAVNERGELPEIRLRVFREQLAARRGLGEQPLAPGFYALVERGLAA